MNMFASPPACPFCPLANWTALCWQQSLLVTNVCCSFLYFGIKILMWHQCGFVFWHAHSTAISGVSCNSVTSKVSLNYNLNKHVFNLTVYYYYYYYYYYHHHHQKN